MTKQQIDDVAAAARVAAIGQAVQGGNRCVFAIVVCGLDVGAPMAVQTNVTDATDEQVIRILQNGIRALQNRPGGGKTGGGLILLSVLAVVFAVAALLVGCGSVTTTEVDHVETHDAAPADAAPAGMAGAGGTDAGPGAGGAAGVAGGSDAGAAGAAGAAGGAAGGGQAAGAAGMTGGAGGAGMTGAAGAGGSCAPRGTCYQCPAPRATCPTAGAGAWLCCNQAGLAACDPAWCSP